VFTSRGNTENSIENFHVEGGRPDYSSVIPRLYRLCLERVFTPGKIMPSRACCPGERPVCPVSLITRHFGTFPFKHGLVGGIVATGRHDPHSHHGNDLVIIQAELAEALRAQPGRTIRSRSYRTRPCTPWKGAMRSRPTCNGTERD